MESASTPVMPGAGDLLRVAVALLWLILPGVAVTWRLACSLTERLALATACALSIGLALSALLAALGAGFDVLYVALWVIAGASVALVLWRRARAEGVRGDGDRLVCAAAAVALVVGVVTTRPLGAASDALDHIGTARAIVARGEIEPNTVFYADGDGAVPDARKGPGHALLAALARTAGLDPVRTWYALRGFALAGALCAFGMLARVLTGPGLPLLVSLLAFPLVVHGESIWFLDTFLYPHNLNWLLIWPTLALAVSELREPARWRRILLVLLSAPLAALHVFAPVLLTGGVACVCVGCALFADPLRRSIALRTFGLVALATLPLLVARLVVTYRPVNPLHVQASEVLYITEFLSLHSPVPMLRRFSAAALLVAVLGLFLIRRPSSVARASLIGLTLGPLLVSLNPVMGGLLIPRIGYLFVRFLGLVPFPAIAGALVGDAQREGGLRRVVPAGVAVLLLVSRIPAVGGFLRHAPAGPTPEAWHAGFALVAAHTARNATVLSDPLTSFALPAYTGRRVVTTLDQHSSPSDSTILRRMDQAARALSPYRPIEEAVEASRRYAVDAILVNPFRDGAVETFFDVRTPALAESSRASFGASRAFRVLGEREGFTLFAPASGAAADTTHRHGFPGRVAGLAGEGVELAPSVELVRLTFAPDTLSPGDTLRVVAVLRKHAQDAPATSYRMVFRLRQALAGAHARFAPVERLYARLLREGGGPRLELAVNRRPTDGTYPFALWDVGETIADSFLVVLPEDLEPGEYRAGFRMNAQRLIRNIALRDLLRPRGGIGYPVGEILVRAVE